MSGNYLNEGARAHISGSKMEGRSERVLSHAPFLVIRALVISWIAFKYAIVLITKLGHVWLARGGRDLYSLDLTDLLYQAEC